MMRAIALAILFALAAQTSFADTSSGALSDPNLEARAVSLQKELRCLVCQGQSLDESNAQLAQDLRHFIRVRIAAGETNDQVKQDLIARYGDVILMEPPLNPATYLLWFGPFLVLMTGACVVGVVIFGARKKPTPHG